MEVHYREYLIKKEGILSSCNFTREDLLSTLDKLNNDTERTLAQYLNQVIINDKLKFNRDPLLMNFRFSVLDKEVTVKTEFSMRINIYRESQISAEILACALTNFNSVKSPTAGESFPPDNLIVTISRFPSDNEKITRYGYDYANKDHRRLILDLLLRLKECAQDITEFDIAIYRSHIGKEKITRYPPAK
ncbi:hypothetical protein Glove_144g164 [Diversispora epigaea]|uniref:Uncharacterized protein n=1 Tax=Diversispora epigaea TaxID=1348612 RepID=A0A397IU89_9GLOM|nr:hypothetical protein Glove_144g164 [Diversispora epigaea]